jgi:hypothetical protein
VQGNGSIEIYIGIESRRQTIGGERGENVDERTRQTGHATIAQPARKIEYDEWLPLAYFFT